MIELNMAKFNVKNPQTGEYEPLDGASLAEKLDTADVDADISSTSTNPVQNKAIQAPLAVLVNKGAKNLVIDFGQIEHNGCVFTYGSDGRITVTGTKSTALAMAEFISNQNLSNYGLSAGDKIVVVNDNKNVGVEIIFADDQGTADPSISVYNETRMITIPSGRTKWYLRLQIKPSVMGTINESIKPMVCDKKLYDVDPTVTPYAKSNYELTRDVRSIPSLVDRGAKNLAKFDIWAKQCSLVRGTKTIGSDGAITITATSSDCYTLFSSTDFPVECRIPVTPGHEMVATWTASETGSGNKYLYIFPNGGTTDFIAIKSSEGIERFTVPDGCTYITWRIGCSASGDTLTFNNLMICSAADYDASSAYEPYALPNTTITPAFIKQVNEGAKNKFDIFNAAEEKSETVTRTINADGTVTVSNSGSNPSPSVLYYQTYLTAGVPYVISGCPSGGSDSSYLLSVRTFDGATIKNSIDTGSGSNAFTVSTSGMYVLYLRIAARYAFSNIVFKPMICTAEDWEASHKFVPYAPTNRELYEAQADSMKLVYRSFPGETSRTVTYQMATTDFSNIGNARYCGMYLIMVVNWSTTPSVSIYSACYSGGTLAYHTLTKIGGADAQLTIDENAVITYTGKGKIQIYALQ